MSDPVLKAIDYGRVLVLFCLGTGAALTKPSDDIKPTKPNPFQPWLLSPAEGSTINAGKVTFQGTGPKGSKIEVLENGRLAADGWIDKNGNWKTVGKVFGDIPDTKIFARVKGGLQTPIANVRVNGKVAKTLTITTPKDLDFVKSGTVYLAGTGKPGDEVLLAYRGKALAKVVVGPSGLWTKEVTLVSMEEGDFKAYSKAEAEIALVYVTGPG